MRSMTYLINRLCIKTYTPKEKNKQENNTAEKDFCLTCHVTGNKRYYSQSQRKYAFVNSEKNKICTRTEIRVTEKYFQCKK